MTCILSYDVAWNLREAVSTNQTQVSQCQVPGIVRLGAGHPTNYFLEIARLHSDEIRHGVLPKLGIEFLGALYRALAAAPRTGVWAAFEDGKIVGFLAGCADVRRTYRWVLARPTIWVRLAAAAPAVWRLGMGRLLSPFTYVRGRSTRNDGGTHAMSSMCAAELLAIAVRPAARGRGLATGLVTAFETALCTWSVLDCYRVSTNVTDRASNRFYRILGFSPKGTLRHHDLVLQIYERSLAARVSSDPGVRSETGPGSDPVNISAPKAP
jgi:GNAT superfamily N-acetyltransferase